MKLEILDKRETIQSLNPPETAFGFTYHAHMIPPFNPNRILMLGSIGETIEKLIYKIWDDAVIDPIDLKFGVDAREYIKDDPNTWDYIVVDLWNDDKVCEFIYDKEFVENLHKISSRMISLNIPITDLNKCFQVYTEAGFKYERHDQVEANGVIFFSVEEK